MASVSSFFRKYFIPNDSNDHQPHILRHEAIVFFFLTIIVVELGLVAQVFTVFNHSKLSGAVLPATLTTITNEERMANNTAPLTPNPLLDKAAAEKAEDMAANGYFEHVSPDGKSPWYWLDHVGYKYSAAGENLAVNFFGSKDVANAWMNSPEHRANIVNKGYTEVGTGSAEGMYKGKETVFVVQLFGTPVPAMTIAPTPKTIIPSKPITKPKVVTKSKSVTINNKTSAPALDSVPTITAPIIPPFQTQSLAQVRTDIAPSKVEPEPMFESILAKVLATPLQYANYIYGLIAITIFFALLLVMFTKKENKNPFLLVRGLALVGIIVFIFYMNIKVLNLDTVGEASASNLTNTAALDK